MPGPARKNPATRQRRNTYAGEAELPAEGRTAPAPELPACTLVDGIPAMEWPARIDLWWRTIWASPMATRWDEATDVGPLARLATLHVLSLAGDSKAAAEARQLEDRYGLSPQARNKLGWTIAEAPDEAPAADERPRGTVTLLHGGADPRDALSAPGR